MKLLYWCECQLEAKQGNSFLRQLEKREGRTVQTTGICSTVSKETYLCRPFYYVRNWSNDGGKNVFVFLFPQLTCHLRLKPLVQIRFCLWYDHCDWYQVSENFLLFLSSHNPLDHVVALYYLASWERNCLDFFVRKGFFFIIDPVLTLYFNVMLTSTLIWMKRSALNKLFCFRKLVWQSSRPSLTSAA